MTWAKSQESERILIVLTILNQNICLKRRDKKDVKRDLISRDPKFTTVPFFRYTDISFIFDETNVKGVLLGIWHAS